MHSKSQIVLENSRVKEGKVLYSFRYEGEVSEAFQGCEQFEIDYAEDITSVPESIIAIPFLVNVLPIAWIYDAIVIVPSIDDDFYSNLPSVKQGYVNMYPRIHFGGELQANKIVKDTSRKKSKSAGLLFSGGVDATSSLISMLKDDLTPRLITVWGADVTLEDKVGWKEKSKHTNYVGSIFGLETSFITSNFRRFLNEPLLSNRVIKNAGDKWWHGFQHGIGLIGLTAPLVYKHGLKETHIAATFVAGENFTCASDPTIDEHVHMGNSRVIHNGYDLTRQAKVRNIHQYMQESKLIKSLPIKVCWQSQGAKNCGRCEKCMRTACEFIVEGGDVSYYSLDTFNADYMRQHLIKDNLYIYATFWKEIQDRIRVSQYNSKDIDSIRWLLDVDFDKVNNTLDKRIKILLSSVREAVKTQTPTPFKNLIKKSIPL